jgi:hypothetical protein
MRQRQVDLKFNASLGYIGEVTSKTQGLKM